MIRFIAALGLLFIGLKLAEVGEVAAWSWWWVLSPFWLPIVGLVVGLIAAVMTAYYQGRRH